MRALEHPWNSRRFNAGQVRVFISGRVLDSVALEFLTFCFRAARRYRSLRPPLSFSRMHAGTGRFRRRDSTFSHLFSRFFSLSLFRAFRPIQRIKEKRVDRDRTIRPIAAAITKTPERFPRLSLSEILLFFLLSNLFVYVAITSDLAGARTSWSPTRTDGQTDGPGVLISVPSSAVFLFLPAAIPPPLTTPTASRPGASSRRVAGHRIYRRIIRTNDYPTFPTFLAVLLRSRDPGSSSRW